MKVEASDGRLHLPEELRRKFGDRFELVDDGERILLVPVADDSAAGAGELESAVEPP